MLSARLVLGCLVCALTACGGFERAPLDAGPSDNNNNQNNNNGSPDSGVAWNGMPSRNILVKFVLDGDTILVQANDTVRTPDGRPMDGEKIRLIGIDAPEIAHAPSPADCWGDDAHAFTETAIGGRIVTLDWDTTHCNPPSQVVGCRDDYDRLLAYVVIGDEVHNENMVKTGNARVFRGARFTHRDSAKYSTLESAARAADLGLWSCP